MLGLKPAAVGASADGEGGEDLAVVGVEHDTGLGVVAHGEEDVVLRVEAQTRRPAALAGKVVVRRHLEGLDVHDRDVVLVFEANIQVALAVAGGLLGRAAQVNRADHGAVLGVNDGGVGLAVAEDVNAFRQGFEDDAVGPALHLDGLDGLRGSWHPT